MKANMIYETQPSVTIDIGYVTGTVNRTRTVPVGEAAIRQICLYLKKLLEAHGISVLLTCEEGEDPEPKARGDMAKGSDFFISLRSNAMNRVMRGTNVFYSLFQPKNRAIATRFSKETAAFFDHPDLGAKDMDFFKLLRYAVAAGCPYVFLAEIGFYDNWQDRDILLQDENQQKIAQIYADIILDVLGVNN